MEELTLNDLGGIDLSKASSAGTMPTGWYQVKAVKAEMKKTKAGTGSYINCRYEISGGDKYVGAGFFKMFNVKNPNETAENIGLGQLRAFQEAALGRELSALVPFDEVLGRDVMAKVVIKEGRNGHGDSNDISQFKTLGK